MAAIKVTKSGKGVQFIDEQGNVFGTSVAYLQSLLMGTLKHKFIIPQRMPFVVNPDRFPKSELWIPEGMDREYIEEQQRRLAEKGITNGNDAFSRKETKNNSERKHYTQDADVW